MYFLPTEQIAATFPISNLPADVIESCLTSEELNQDNPDINSIINESEDGELIEFYNKYQSKNFEKTAAQKKLNKTKVYVIVKSKIIKGKKVTFAVPIRSFDSLGNTISAKSKQFIASIFYVRLNDGRAKLPPIDAVDSIENESRAVTRAANRALNRHILLDHLLATQVPFGSRSKIKVKSLKPPAEYDVDGNIIPEKPLLFSKEGYIDEQSAKEYIERLNRFDDTYSMMDNTRMANVYDYVPDMRGKKIFSDEKKPTLLRRLRGISFERDVVRLFNLHNFVDFVFRDRSARVDKNIIPVFSKLEDAQDLLVTVLEEVNHPFKARRKIETYNTPQYYRSLDYLDDSFSFQNRYFPPDRTDLGDVIRDLLRRYRIIKPRNIKSDNNYYSEDKYQIKGPFYIENVEIRDPDEYIPMSQLPPSAPKWIWREDFYWAFMRIYFPGQHEAYSYFETRDMTRADKVLLQKSQDVKIISMGLSDFLEFWNNHQQKNAGILFIPSSDSLDSLSVNKKKLPLLAKKSRDHFYDYQQKYRGLKKHDTDKYSYEITISS